jgi:hypothetical protein
MRHLNAQQREVMRPKLVSAVHTPHLGHADLV